MLKRIWQQLVRWFQQLFGRRQTPATVSAKEVAENYQAAPPPPLDDTDLEFLFTQLLEGVHQGRGQEWALKWLRNVQNRVPDEQWVEWLRRFGARLLASPAPNNELAARLVQLGELGCGEVGDAAYDIGMQLLTRNPGEPVWDYDGPDASPIVAQEGVENVQEGAVQAVTVDELLVLLQQDANFRQLVAQQLGIETTDPQVLIEALVKQYNAEAQ